MDTKKSDTTTEAQPFTTEAHTTTDTHPDTTQQQFPTSQQTMIPAMSTSNSTTNHPTASRTMLVSNPQTTNLPADTTTDAQPFTTEAHTTTDTHPNTTQQQFPTSQQTMIPAMSTSNSTTNHPTASRTMLVSNPQTTNLPADTTTDAQPFTTEAHTTTDTHHDTTQQQFPTSQQTMTSAMSVSTTYHPTASRTMLYGHLTTQQIAFGNSEELNEVLAAFQENIEIPTNATEEETVQLIQDYSEMAIKLIFPDSSDETNTTIVNVNPAELTEGTEVLLGNLATKLPPGGSIRVVTETVVAEVRSLVTNDTQRMASFSVAGGVNSTKAALDVPLDKLNEVNGTITVTLVYVDHSIVGSSNVSLESRNSDREQDNNTETTVGLASGILSSTVYVDGNQFNVDPKLKLEYHKKVPESQQAFRTESKTICAFWNAKESTWSTEGCEKVTQRNVQVTCYCNHTTSYAVLLQITTYPIPKFHSVFMTYLTNIGCVLSILSLAMSFFIFMIFESLRTAEHYIIHSNFAMALLAAQMSFLLGADQTSNQTLCKIIAITIHYLYLCVFCWMLVEGINLYIKVVLVFNTEKSKLLYYTLLGWGVPIIIVAVCAGLAWDQYATESR
ncbi:adhesion G protein-coupled receptor L2-like [Amphiura filiformis]|uniref:adhesion G protein-coupled receptor L2-like n=1 Tax=Amphiura filiformis TaxID=82378 RepID=UPI003B215901